MYTKVIQLYIHIEVSQTKTNIIDIMYLWNLKKWYK